MNFLSFPCLTVMYTFALPAINLVAPPTLFVTLLIRNQRFSFIHVLNTEKIV